MVLSMLKEIALEIQMPMFMSFTEILLILCEGCQSFGIKRGSMASIHREYGLYVNYSCHSRKWNSFKDRYDPLATIFTNNGVKTMVDLLRKACNAFSIEVRSRPLFEANFRLCIGARPSLS